MLIEHIEKLKSEKRKSVEATPTIFLLLRPKILNFEVRGSLKHHEGDIIPMQSPIVTDSVTPYP